MSKFIPWPADAFDLDAAKLISMYEQGFSGAFKQPEEAEALMASQQYASAEDAALDNNWADSGAGKLCIPYVFAMQHWAGCWPGPGQTTGDCVSWGTRNACLTLAGCDIASAKPDEQTGLIEGAVEVSEE